MASAEKGVCGAGLHHDRTTGGDRRPRLARDHGRGKIPWRDRGDDADGLAQHHDAFVGLVAGNDVAVEALAFLGEPLDEGSRVGDLAFRFRQRLALLGGHDDGEIIDVREHEIEPAPHDLRALGRRLLRPGGQGGVRGLDSAARFGGAHVRHAAEHLAVGGIADLGS